MEGEVEGGLPGDPVRQITSRGARPNDRGNLETLDQNIQESFYRGDKWSSNLEPYFRTQYDLGVTKPGIGVGLIVSGQVRTMLEPDMVAGYREVVKRLGASKVHIFAYLEPVPGQIYPYRKPRAPWNPGYDITRELLHSSLESWGGAGFELQLHGDVGNDGPFLPDAAASCGLSSSVVGRLPSQFHQFSKVAAAAAMLKRHESTRGRRFAMVVRLRPDLCPASFYEFLSVSSARASPPGARPVFTVYDAAAVMPRWALDAYASAWRTFAGGQCSPDPAWAETEVAAPSCHLGGALETHLVALGVEPVDLHYFWATADDRNSSNLSTNEPALRRPDRCVAFC